MKRIILTSLLVLSFFMQSFAQAFQESEAPLIIPRNSWGANTLFNSLYDVYWQEILQKRKEYAASHPVSPQQGQESAEKRKKINGYLNENFAYQFDIEEKITQYPDGKKTYAWPLKYMDEVDGIVVHHTATEYSDSYSGIKDIHKFHSLSRQWGDIGYNYIIGYDGEIFEGREGGEYVESSHSKYNNSHTVGIAVMGNYEEKSLNQAQYESLKSLIEYLAHTYGIDLGKKTYYHMDCDGEACETFPLETKLDSTLVGHRETGHTGCPGDGLGAQIEQIRSELVDSTAGLTAVPRNSYIASSTQENTTNNPVNFVAISRILARLSDSELQQILVRIDELLSASEDGVHKKTLQILKVLVQAKIEE